MVKKVLVCVDGLCVTGEGVLLVRRRLMPFIGFWGLPGGIVEHNESLEDACKREFKEETGYNIMVNEILGARIEEHPNQTRVIIIFDVKIKDGKLLKSEEHSEIGFYKKPQEK